MSPFAVGTCGCFLKVLRTFRSKPGDWAALYGAVSAARTLLVHHPDVFGADETTEGTPGLVNLVVTVVVDAVSHNRSVVQSSGLRCFQELFRCAWC